MTSSSDYIRGQRAAFERAAQSVEDCARNGRGLPAEMAAEIRAEAAKLPEADAEGDWDGAPMIEIDRDLAGWKEQAQGWRARAELYRNKARENGREAEKLETALAAMTERCRVLEEALRPFTHSEWDEPSGQGLVFTLWNNPDHDCTVGDIRCAAAVLTAERGGSDA